MKHSFWWHRNRFRRRIVWLLLSGHERNALLKLRSQTKGRHYANMHVRRNGKDEYYEVDYLTGFGGITDLAAAKEKPDAKD